MALPLFPAAQLPGITYPVGYTLAWDTVKHDAISGKRIRFGNWTYPIHKYNLPISTLRTDASLEEWQTLVGFINSVQGAAQLWAYDDPNDDTVANQEFGVGDGTTTAFQLVRSLGGFVEPIFLVDQFPVINVAGSPTLAYTLSAAGLVTFNSAPTLDAALSWTGTYKWPCRFDDDTTDMSQFVFNMFEAKSLKFSSEKLDTLTGGSSPQGGTQVFIPTVLTGI